MLCVHNRHPTKVPWVRTVLLQLTICHPAFKFSQPAEMPHDSIVSGKSMAIPRPPGDQKIVLGACQEILWPQAQGDFLFPSQLLILV